ncbi:MAG: CHASE2 domain-containing protein [Candidatus Omnitrophica bacterium]|nr:CHASE2 domain-containing protein [Candidatus Omnitrophota bacterium]
MLLPLNDFPNIYSYRFFRDRIKLPAKIVAVAIDDYSMNKVPQRWPWPRSVYADFLRNLDLEGAKVIAFDRVLKGSSQDSEDALSLSQAMQEIRAKVVLGNDFDFDQLSPGTILADLPAQHYTPGVINTFMDEDGVIRRMTGFFKTGAQNHYSLSVITAGVYSGKSPADIVSSMSIIRDPKFLRQRNFQNYCFYIDYRIKQFQRSNAVPVVSFYDCLYNMAGLKAELGGDFLRNSIVLLYPSAEILHDMQNTPLGKMPGGFAHINSIINILSGFTVKSSPYATAILFILSAIALVLAVRLNNFQTSLQIFTVVLLFNFIVPLILWGFHIKVDSSRIFAFCAIFFVAARISKSLEFMARLNAIKDRATIDPLRGIYTLRYFGYRLELEVRRRRVFGMIIYLENFKDRTDEMSFERLRQIWAKIQVILSAVPGCWAGYSSDEVAGYLGSDNPRPESELETLKSELEKMFASLDMDVRVKMRAVLLDKNFSFTEAFSSLSGLARSAKAAVLVLPDESKSNHPQSEHPAMQEQVLDGLAADIEEKNRQLLILYEKLKAEHGKTKEAFYQIITSLVNALEARDPYTQGHSQRVAKYALLLADKLNWPQDQKDRLLKASLLHDLGKIGIPDSILHKKSSLTEEEFKVIKQHEIMAVTILKPLKEIEDILPWILYHHEKWDGSGYPYGLGADAIPLASQMIALADVYDALTTGRDYKIAVSRQDAIAIIQKGRGSHFKPELADLFISII